MLGGYPPTAIGYPPTAIGYTPTAINYPPTAISYTPTAIGYTPTAIGYPPTAISYPPAAIIGRIGHSEFFFFIMATPGFYGGHSTGYKLGNHPKNIEPCAHRARTVRQRPPREGRIGLVCSSKTRDRNLRFGRMGASNTHNHKTCLGAFSSKRMHAPGRKKMHKNGATQSGQEREESITDRSERHCTHR